MEWQNILDIAVAAVSAIFGWFFKVFWDAIKDLKEEIKETNKVIHEQYVRKDDYRVEMSKIENMFNRIMDKLDGKVDKQ